jgi:hypothetical protein
LWPLIGNVERHPEWSMDEIEISPIGPDRFLSKVRAGARTLTAQIHVITATENELLEFRVRDETGTYMHRIGLAELEDGTLVSRQVTPTQLSLGQRVLSTAAKSPSRVPSLHGSLHRLAEAAAHAR